MRCSLHAFRRSLRHTHSVVSVRMAFEEQRELKVAVQPPLRALEIAEANGWLDWCIRASCSNLRCDAWAARELKARARVNCARSRSYVRAMLKPDVASVLSSRLHGLTLPPDCMDMAAWLERLYLSFVAYVSLVRSIVPPTLGQNGVEASYYFHQLKHSHVSSAEIAQRIFPALHGIAGHLKLCEGKLELVGEQIGSTRPENEEDLEYDSLDNLLADIDMFVDDIRIQIEHRISL